MISFSCSSNKNKKYYDLQTQAFSCATYNFQIGQIKRNMLKTLLLPGGLGYIGSHTIVELLDVYKIKIVVIDNYQNCREDVTERLFKILTPEDQKLIHVRKGDILDTNFLERVFQEQVEELTPIEGIIHFAAKKNANESVVEPIMYYENNVQGTLNLLRVMEKFKTCKHFIFSSTAAVYGDQDQCTELFDCKPLSPYGESKLAAEMLIKSLSKIHKNWKMISLRYFNPAGAHSSGYLGDWPSKYPGNLFPVIQDVVIGRRSTLKVFGDDYNTHDGSGVRDYLHVVDLAKGHVAALEQIVTMGEKCNYDVFNLGSGCGYSVLEVLSCFQKGLGKEIKYEIAPRREGDMPKLVANVDKSRERLKWQTVKTLQQMCDSCINFAKVTLSKNAEIDDDI